MNETTSNHWKPPPKRLQLAEASLHVWRADLGPADDGVDELLSADERARAQRFVSARDRERWTRARGILRALLGHYLDSDAGTLRFSVGARGKPALLHEPARTDAAEARLCFNLSHSQDLALYAFARTQVGVDVEVARPGIDAIALAERVFGHGEGGRLRRLPESARAREFLRAWVRHEASLKCYGSGLGASAGRHGLWLAELEVGTGAAAAVALDRAPRQLCLWEWPAPRIAA
jgi:4'-phosphopantetheinyl transferase